MSDLLTERIDRRLEVLKREREREAEAKKRPPCGCKPNECLQYAMTSAMLASTTCRKQALQQAASARQAFEPGKLLDASDDNEFEPFNPERCRCGDPNRAPPCGYCESGEYLPD